MTEEGTVTRVEGKKAWVLAIRGTACESCGSKNMCNPLGGNSKKIEIEAVNSINARVGNMVNVSIPSSSVMKAAFMVYMIPIIMLFAGVIVGNWFAGKYNYNKELSALITGLFAFAFTFLVLKIISRRISKKPEFIPVITKIIG